MPETTIEENVFGKYFQIVEAKSSKDIATAFQLRHRVFCNDLKWETARDDGLLFDTSDRYSIQLLVRNKQTGKDIGCVRLVLGEQGVLPIEKKCEGGFMDSGWAPGNQTRRAIAEMSHVAIINEYRRRRGEDKVPVGDIATTGGKPRFAWILVGLYAGVLALAMRHKITNLYFLVGTKQAKQLDMVGMANKIIGLSIHEHGARVPVVMDVPWVVDNLDSRARMVYDQAMVDILRNGQS